jgi:hypothetical protein
VEGCFTTFNAALARSALKKERYLNGSVEVVPPSVSAPAAVPFLEDVPTAEGPRLPAVSPGAAVHPLFAPKPASAFADKLKQALEPVETKQEG